MLPLCFTLDEPWAHFLSFFLLIKSAHKNSALDTHGTLSSDRGLVPRISLYPRESLFNMEATGWQESVGGAVRLSISHICLEYLSGTEGQDYKTTNTHPLRAELHVLNSRVSIVKVSKGILHLL